MRVGHGTDATGGNNGNSDKRSKNFRFHHVPMQPELRRASSTIAIFCAARQARQQMQALNRVSKQA
jgi:hypothetical protein